MDVARPCQSVGKAKPSEAKVSLGHFLAGYFFCKFSTLLLGVRCIWTAKGMLEDTVMDEVAQACTGLFTFLMMHRAQADVFALLNT